MIRQTKPGLVALYDIRPENGAGLVLTIKWSPHGARSPLYEFPTFSWSFPPVPLFVSIPGLSKNFSIKWSHWKRGMQH